MIATGCRCVVYWDSDFFNGLAIGDMVFQNSEKPLVQSFKWHKLQWSLSEFASQLFFWVIQHILFLWCFWIVVLEKTEKAMAPHSSTLAWKIPWVEDPGWLQSMESLRVRHDWVTSLWLFTFMHWRRKWQSTPVFLPGESQGRGSLVGCCLWGRIESDTTGAT